MLIIQVDEVGAVDVSVGAFVLLRRMQPRDCTAASSTSQPIDKKLLFNLPLEDRGQLNDYCLMIGVAIKSGCFWISVTTVTSTTTFS